MNQDTQLYLENKKTILCKVKQHTKQGIEFDDLVSQANYTFVKCLRRYEKINPKAQFNTYLSKALDYDLSYYLIFYTLKWEQLLDSMYNYNYEMDINQFNFSYWLKSLSRNSQEIIYIIFEEALELITSIHSTKITRESIKKYLRNHEWSFKKIDFCFNEIKLALKEI